MPAERCILCTIITKKDKHLSPYSNLIDLVTRSQNLESLWASRQEVLMYGSHTFNVSSNYKSTKLVKIRNITTIAILI